LLLLMNIIVVYFTVLPSPTFSSISTNTRTSNQDRNNYLFISKFKGMKICKLFLLKTLDVLGPVKYSNEVVSLDKMVSLLLEFWFSGSCWNSRYLTLDCRISTPRYNLNCSRFISTPPPS
jgi:hypothetical protein